MLGKKCIHFWVDMKCLHVEIHCFPNIHVGKNYITYKRPQGPDRRFGFVGHVLHYPPPIKHTPVRRRVVNPIPGPTWNPDREPNPNRDALPTVTLFLAPSCDWLIPWTWVLVCSFFFLLAFSHFLVRPVHSKGGDTDIPNFQVNLFWIPRNIDHGRHGPPK